MNINITAGTSLVILKNLVENLFLSFLKSLRHFKQKNNNLKRLKYN